MSLALKLLLAPALAAGFTFSSLAGPITPALSRTPAPRRTQPTTLSPSQLYKKVIPSVVTVLVGNGHGSGFIVSSDGLIVTNAHVTDGAPKVVTVKFADGTTAPADVLGFSANREDLSLLKVNVARKLPALPLASNRSIQVGDRVYALGSPLAEENANTFTQGDVIRLDGPNKRVFHTALIHGGNSGGPLVDARGQVVGVNTAVVLNRARSVFGDDGKVIGQVYAETPQGIAIDMGQVHGFLREFRQGKLSSVATYENADPVKARRQQAQRQVRAIDTDGKVVEGRLEAGDNTLSDGSYADAYSFTGQAGQQIQIDLASTDFNPLSLLFVADNQGNLSGKPIAQNDDAGPGSLDSRIVFVLPSNGTYYILVNSKVSGETGQYRVSAQLR